MGSRVVVKIPSNDRWIEMKGYLQQWKLTLPPKFVVEHANRREIRDTIERAHRIVKTHECAAEFAQMLDSIAIDPAKGPVLQKSSTNKSASRSQGTGLRKNNARKVERVKSRAPSN